MGGNTRKRQVSIWLFIFMLILSSITGFSQKATAEMSTDQQPIVTQSFNEKTTIKSQLMQDLPFDLNKVKSKKQGVQLQKGKNSIQSQSFHQDKQQQQTNERQATAPTPTATLAFPRYISDWELDNEAGLIYAISSTTNTLYFINKETLTIEKELNVGSMPSDMARNGDMMYIALSGATMIQIVNLKTKTLGELINATAQPQEVAVTSERIFYYSSDNYVHYYDFATKTNTKINNLRNYNSITLEVSEDNRTLYIGETGSSGCDFVAYDYIEGKLVGDSRYDDGYGFGFPYPKIFLDEKHVYYGGHRMNKENIAEFNGAYMRYGSYSYLISKIMDISDNYVVTDQAIIDKETYLKVAELPVEPVAALVDDQGKVFLLETNFYQEASSNIIKSYNLPLVPPDLIEMNPVNQELTISNYPITDWATDDQTPYIYIISEDANELAVLRKDDFSYVKSMWIGSRPLDVEVNNGKVYVALRGESHIAVFDVASTELPNVNVTRFVINSTPNKIIPFDNNIIYSGGEVDINILTESNDMKLVQSNNYYNRYFLDYTEKMLYTGGHTGLSKINPLTQAVLQTAPVPNNYSGTIIKDGNSLYYGNQRLSASDLKTIYGSYQDGIIYANGKIVFSSRAIHDRDTFTKLIDLPFSISKALVQDDGSILLTSGDKFYNFTSIEAIQEYIDTNLLPSSPYLIDTDEREGYIGGYLAFQPALDNDDIQFYKPYFLDMNGNKVGQIVMNLDETLEDGTDIYKLSSGITVPPEAVSIGLFTSIKSINEEYSKPAVGELWDMPTYLPTEFDFNDTNPDSKIFSGTVTWGAGKKEPADATYSIFFVNDEGRIGAPLKTVATGKAFYSETLTNVVVPVVAKGVALFLEKNNGSMPPFYSVLIFPEYMSQKIATQNISIQKYEFQDDKVTVSNLQEGDIIRVYDETETYLLGEATVPAGKTNVTLTIIHIGNPGEKISVTREMAGKYESDGTIVVIPNFTVQQPPIIITPPPSTGGPPVTPKVHTITVTAGAHGTINPSGSVSVVEETNQTFTITPEKGYEIDTLQIDGVDVTVTETIKSYTFVNVKSNHKISVTFKAVKDITAPLAPAVNEIKEMITTITGIAEAGAKVTAKVGIQVIGETVASATGQFNIKIAKQVFGTTIVITATDAANNESSPTEVIVKDGTPPSAPVVKVVKDYDKKVSGKAEARSIVSVKVGSKVIGKAEADNDGNFTVVISSQKAGTVLKVMATDLAKNNSKPTSVTVIDKTPPARPTVDTVASTSSKVTGKAEVGSAVIVKVGSKVIGTATVGKDGKFSVKIPKQKARVVLTVSVKDKKGNESAALKVTIKK